ncbi:HAD-IIB family hydrolase [Paenibacillus medicaginis]|uniref:HAD-IIB family hydrolase n=1 Tax=Paenibacillus medicaginis TaxID=1470560 RepID=A0ABV5C1D6_9BACL
MNNVKLIASDMDHTLLTEKGELPPNFDQYILELDKLGIVFAIASERALYTLEDMFPEIKDKICFISDNGGIISYKGEVIFKSLLKPADYQPMIRFVEDNTNGIAILCGLDSAYIAGKYKGNEAFLKTFYSNITFVEELDQVITEAAKLTIYFPNKNSKQYFEETFKPKYGYDFSVTAEDAIWIDIMNHGINKGKAMKVLGERLGKDSEQMMVFGDMEQYASYAADSNDHFGVLKSIEKILEIHGKK